MGLTGFNFQHHIQSRGVQSGVSSGIPGVLLQTHCPSEYDMAPVFEGFRAPWIPKRRVTPRALLAYELPGGSLCKIEWEQEGIRGMYKKINTAEPQRSVGPVYASWAMQHPHLPSKVQSEGAPKGGLASPQSHSWDPGSAEQSGLLEAGRAGTFSQLGMGTPPQRIVSRQSGSRGA